MPTEDLFRSLDIGLRRDIDAFLVEETAHLKKRSKIKVSAGIAEIDSAGATRILYRRGFRSGKEIHLASMSKQFTGAAIALLQEEDPDFNNDTFVANLVPQWPSYANAVQIKHLLNHSSGLREYANLGPAWPFYTPSSIIPYLNNSALSLSQVPGTEFRYNNSAYVVLARIVELLAGVDFPDFMRTRFFEPLGMRATFLRGFNQPPPDVMKLYYRNNLFESHRAPWTLDWMPGDGGVYSNIDDLFLWGQFLSGTSVLGPEVPARLFSAIPLNDETGSYGYGFYLNRNFARPARYGFNPMNRFSPLSEIEPAGPAYTFHQHGGRMPALRSRSYFFPSQRNKPAVWMGVLINSSNLDQTEILDRMRLLYFRKYR